MTTISCDRNVEKVFFFAGCHLMEGNENSVDLACCF